MNINVIQWALIFMLLSFAVVDELTRHDSDMMYKARIESLEDKMRLVNIYIEIHKGDH
jgi:hypothetical protein